MFDLNPLIVNKVREKLLLPPGKGRAERSKRKFFALLMTPICLRERETAASAARNLCFMAIFSLLAGCAGGMSRSGGMQLAGCPVNGSKVTKEPQGNARTAEELMIVDCQLPGLLIEMGQGILYNTPPRPARVSVWQCRASGGQHVVFDAANLNQVADLWKACAEGGDQIAQTYLGELYERAADYQAAANWYRKAAEQGYSRAQANLGFLFEKGLGVSADNSASLEWYRKAAGLPAQALRSVKNSEEISQLKAELAKSGQLLASTQAKLKQIEAEKANLNRQIQQNNRQSDAQGQSQNRELALRVSELEKKAVADQALIGSLEAKISQSQASIRGQDLDAETDLPPVSQGRYFALVIGINDYSSLSKLATPVNDAKAVAELLSTKYGFTTKLLLNQEATRNGILNALIDLQQQLTENDSLLVYYAGHGQEENQFGYWMPIDADKPPRRATWISDDEIAKNTMVGFMRARHVLIVADSCFAGAMRNVIFSTPPQTTRAGGAGSRSSIQQVKFSLASRKYLASGGDEPVLDKGRANHSVFAGAFIDFLKNYNKLDPVSADALHDHIEEVVFNTSTQLGRPQRPLYGPIVGAGDNAGEFYFKPSLQSAARNQRYFARDIALNLGYLGLISGYGGDVDDIRLF